MRILFAGGGTGGHLIPALNIARCLKTKLDDAEYLFVGIKGGIEKDIVERNGFQVEEIEIVGLKRNFSGMMDFSKKIMRAFSQADKVVRSFGPEVVVGTGGYLSAPVVLAGKRRRSRTLIQEQNVFPGLATRFLARFADRICLAFENSKKYLHGIRNIIVSGNPLRPDLRIPRTKAIYEGFGLDPDKKVLFVTGGSRGARSLNEGIARFIRDGRLPEDWQCLWQTGADRFEETRKMIGRDFPGKLMPFIDNMPQAYAVSDLVVSRAGAMTVSELLALGMPALLVPYPHATADHQMKNALALKELGAVEVVADRYLLNKEFQSTLSELIANKEKRDNLSACASKIGNTSGAEIITREIISLI